MKNNSKKENEFRSKVTLDIPNNPVKESSSYWISEPNQTVKLRLVSKDPNEFSNTEPLTIHSVFANTVNKWPNTIALAYKKDKTKPNYTTITYEQYYQLTCDVAKAFIKLGLQEFHSVCIMGFNSVEWFVANIAAIFAGGLSCGIYTTNNNEACQHIMVNSRAQILVVENKRYLEKISPFLHELKNFKKVIVWNDGEPGNGDDFISWKQLIELGQKENNDELIRRLKNQVPNQCCGLIYTSGTTGNSKGVMMSHDNFTWTCRWTQTFYCFRENNERLVSYLPLSHIAAQMVEIYLPMVIGGSTYFAQPDALRGSLRDTLLEVRPTRFLGVPRVYEKMQEKMKEAGESMGYLKKKLAMWAKSVGLEGSWAKINNESLPYGWSLANILVFRKAKEALGLDQCITFVSSAAPISRSTVEFFMSLDIPILEIYGMSESTGPQTLNLTGANRVSSVGRSLKGCDMKLLNKDNEGNGEVSVFGRNIFMGYLAAPEKTLETLTKEGWLLTGDIGRFDKDEYLFITGRIKELIITAGGENVAPIPIEENIYRELPCISHAMVIGDKLKFLSVLLTFKTKINDETQEMLDELMPEAKRWCQQVGCEITKLSQILTGNYPQINEAINKALKVVNDRSVSRACCIQKFHILPRDFSIVGGELGPTLKPRRPVIMKMYAKEIEELYK